MFVYTITLLFIALAVRESETRYVVGARAFAPDKQKEQKKIASYLVGRSEIRRERERERVPKEKA